MPAYRQREATPPEAALLEKVGADPLAAHRGLWYMVCFWRNKPAEPLTVETLLHVDPVGRNSGRTHGSAGRGRLLSCNPGEVKVRKCSGRGADRGFEHWFISTSVGERLCSRCRGRGRGAGELPSYNIPRWRS